MINVEKVVNCLHNILLNEREKLMNIRDNMITKMNSVKKSDSLLEINSGINMHNMKLITIMFGVNTTFEIIDSLLYKNVEVGQFSEYYIRLHFKGIVFSIDTLHCMINVSNNNNLSYDFVYDIEHNQILDINI